MSALLDLRRVLRPHDARDGRKWQEVTRNAANPTLALRREFEDRFRGGRTSDRIILGRGPVITGGYDWFGLPFRDLGHIWIHGATGSGKSFLVLSLIVRLLLRRAARVFLFDFKPELATLVLEAVRALVARDQPWLRDQVQHFNPFGPQPIPLRVTAPEAGVPRSVQALAIATSLEEAVASDLGVRMLRVFVWLTSAAIEFGRPLTDLVRWLRNPILFQELAQRSMDPELREYATASFPREQRATLEAIAARLDLLVFLPQLRQALEEPGCLDFGALYRAPGLTTFTVGGAPAGAEPAERLIGSLLTGMWTRSLLSREIDDDAIPVVGIFDEGQLAVRSRDVEHLSRTATLARARRGNLVFINQQVSQLDSGFARVLRTNTNLELAFRASPEDSASLAAVLPLTLPGSDEASARRALTRTLSHLPNRTFALWAKSLGFAALLRSPRIDLDALRSDAAPLPAGDELFHSAIPVRTAPAEPGPLIDPDAGGDSATDDEFPRLG